MKNWNKRIWPYIVPPPKSPMMLDSFGLTLSLKILMGWNDYMAASRELFGTHWLSRFWGGRIYPIINQKGYLERRRRFEVEQSRMRQYFLAAVLERGIR